MEKGKAAAIIFTAITAMLSCNTLEGDGLLGRQPIGGQGHQPPPVPTAADTVEFVTGIEFPEGYDWGRDTANGQAGSRLIVLADGNRWLELELGESSRISADPARHRVSGRHLYTDFASGGKTYVGKDGEALFDYDGEEILRGFSVDGEDVYTLGQRLSGEGFSLRKNGLELFSGRGEIMGDIFDPGPGGGALSFEDGNASFAYTESAGTGHSRSRSYHLYTGGEETEIALEGGFTEYYDIRMVDGLLCKVGLSGKNGADLTLTIGNKNFILFSGKPPGYSFAGCTIVPPSDGGTILVKGSYRGGGYRNDYVWSRTGVSLHLDADTEILGFATKGLGLRFVARESRRNRMLVFPGGISNREYDGAYRFVSPSCLNVCGDRFRAVLSAPDGRPPLMVKEHGEEELPFYGYATGVWSQP